MKIIHLFFALIGIVGFQSATLKASDRAALDFAPLSSSLFALQSASPLTVNALEEEFFHVTLQEKNKNNLYRYLLERRALLSSTPLVGSAKKQARLLTCCQSMVEILEAEWAEQQEKKDKKRDQLTEVRERMQTLYISKRRSKAIAPHLIRSSYPREKH